MKVIIWSDHQFHPWKEFSKTLGDGRNSRFWDQLLVLDEIFNRAIKEECEMIVHCGDLFEALTDRIDKKVFLDVYERFVKFSENGVIVVLLVGNHDWIDRTETDHILNPFKEIKNVIVVDKPLVQVADDCSFSFVPFSRDNFKEKLIKVKDFSKPKKYLFSHQGVTGARSGSRDMALKEDYNVQDFAPNLFTFVFNGHYHKPQKLLSSFYIVGSPLQKDFGERNDDKRYLILDTDLNEVKEQKVKSAPKFFKLEGDSLSKIKVPEEFREKDFMWVINSSDENPEIDNRFKFIKNLRFEIDKEKQVNLRTDMSISMPIEDQLKTYIKSKESALSEERLISVGVDIWKRSR